MGKGARNRDRRQQDPGWSGLDGRNPLTLSADRLEALVPAAFDRIMTVGTSDGRLSLAACWALGVLSVNELDDADDAPWADDPTPAGLALVGATGPPPADLTSGQLDATADEWFHRLDAAGANDRIRAFDDAWSRLARHDNPHGHPLHLAFALALADDPLTLEPLAERLTPAWLLADDDLDAADAYMPGRSRRVPGARSTRVQLGDEGAAMLDPAMRNMAARGQEMGLPDDATIGDILAADGVDLGSDEQLLQTAESIVAVSPGAAHAFLATDGLILTEMNQHLVSEADARRWSESAGTYEVVFERLDELDGLDLDDPAAEDAVMDATIDGAGALLDELAALVDDGAMLAYDRLLAEVDAHPRGPRLRDHLCTVAFTELTSEIEPGAFAGPLAEDVRRLAAVRFADRDPGMPAAADRALAVTDTLVDGDLPLAQAVDDPDRELAVWVVLVSVWRAAG